MIPLNDPLTILHLYPREMNLYGDHGNVLALRRRCEWRNIPVRVVPLETGSPFPDRVDLIFGGGGQDSGQERVEKDLALRGEKIRALIEDGCPALLICGLYQLFGEGFVTESGESIRGIGLFPAKTLAGKHRLVGNITIQTKRFGSVTGFENHSGRTFLAGAAPFGRVLGGNGNNGKDGTEGILYKNAIGTYLHGPLLPQNPRVADFLLLAALKRRDPSIRSLSPLDDSLEDAARANAASRPQHKKAQFL